MRPDFFPYPTVFRGERYDGSLREWPETCKQCPHRNCEDASDQDVHYCSFGLNYQRVTDELLVAGVAIQGFNPTTEQMRKRRREVDVVHPDEFERAVETYRKEAEKQERARKEAVQEEKRDILDEEQFKVEYLDELKEEVQKGLSFFHDYKQINAQIRQNVNVVIENRYDGGSFEDKLDKASRSERAIYEAARFLEEKLNVARFLVDPQWLHINSECRSFKVHGMVLKYVRIYQSWFEDRGIRVKMIGESYNEIEANPSACGVIPHTFLDNALKYSPEGSEVEVFLDDRDGEVVFEVASYGPRLKKGEKRDIFRPFFRGEEAEVISEEGAGYGLYVSQLVAKDHLGVEIGVEQDSDKRVDDRFWTAFYIRFPQRASILE